MVRNNRPRDKQANVEYRVAWDQERGRFYVFRGKDRTGAFSGQQATAVGVAIQEAKREASETGLKVIVTSMRNGRRIIEWDGRS